MAETSPACAWGRPCASVLYFEKYATNAFRKSISGYSAERPSSSSMRAHDGMFTLKPAGARRLHAAWKAPRMRVVVNEDAVPFVSVGKSAFAKFVTDMDPELRPGDECLVVGPGDELLGVGPDVADGAA